MFARNQSPVMKKYDDPAQIKTEPYDFAFKSIGSYDGNEWTEASCTENYRHDSFQTKENTDQLSEELDSKQGFNNVNFMVQRAEREFVPTNRKDNMYWSKRTKNNDSARRSRMKRRTNEQDVIDKLKTLQKENIELKHELASLNRRFAQQKESLKSLESNNGESYDRKYDNISPHLATNQTSNGDLPNSVWNASERSLRQKQNFAKQNVLQGTSVSETHTPISQWRTKVQDYISNDLHGSSDISQIAVNDESCANATARESYYNNSRTCKTSQLAYDSQKITVTEDEHSSSPVIVSVFSLQNNCDNGFSHSGVDIYNNKQGLQSVPHKYRHKREFHSAFTMQ